MKVFMDQKTLVYSTWLRILAGDLLPIISLIHVENVVRILKALRSWTVSGIWHDVMSGPCHPVMCLNVLQHHSIYHKWQSIANSISKDIKVWLDHNLGFKSQRKYSGYVCYVLLKKLVFWYHYPSSANFTRPWAIK